MARRVAARIPKNRKQPKKRQARGQRNIAAPVLAQGGLQAARNVFGSAGGINVLHGFNALHFSHLTLPRAVAPYCVVRVSHAFTSSAEFVTFGAHKMKASTDKGQDGWFIGATVVDNGGAPLNNTAPTYQKIPQIGSRAQMCPAAITVQAMCTEPLNTASGAVFCGRFTTAIDYAEDGSTYSALAGALVSQMRPRVCTAGKLALRGVQVDLVPSDMSELADFVEQFAPANTLAPSDINLRTAGFLPVMFQNVNNQSMQYIVTAELRVRFDLESVAAAAHEYHKPASLSTWDKAMQIAHTIGHGVHDIAEVVANAGAGVQAVRGAMAEANAIAKMGAIGAV